MDKVVIGADPHKHSVTIEVLDDRERVLHQGRYATDVEGYRQMLAAARRFPQRTWAVEDCNGAGKHGPAPGRRRRDRVRRAGEAGRPGARVRHRQRPQERSS